MSGPVSSSLLSTVRSWQAPGDEQELGSSLVGLRWGVILSGSRDARG